MKAIAASGAVAMLLAGCQQANAPVEETDSESAGGESEISLGNGELNAIETEGLRRDGDNLIVASVTAAGPSFVVMHPFRDGAPVRNEYVAATLVSDGTSENVSVPVDGGFAEGDQFIMMLHSDVNRDGIFDFGDGETVPDAPVFEGATMIAHPITAPGKPG